jgi:hypothetical protein
LTERISRLFLVLQRNACNSPLSIQSNLELTVVTHINKTRCRVDSHRRSTRCLKAARLRGMKIRANHYHAFFRRPSSFTTILQRLNAVSAICSVANSTTMFNDEI